MTAMTRIVVFREKHNEEYYDASTTELELRAFFTVFKQRWDDGYWYDEPKAPEYNDDEEQALQMGQEEIDSFSPSIRNLLTEIRAGAQRKDKEYRRRKRMWDAMVKIADMPSSEAIEYCWTKYTVASGDIIERQVPWIGTIMESRANHEYEGYEFINLAVAQ